MQDKEYIVIVQCHLVKQRCSGYFCEKSFNERTGGFANFAKDKSYRTLNITCGGCCGQTLQRKLTHLIRTLKKQESIGKEKVVVQLSTCITKDNFHGPQCPHLDYLKTIINKTGVDFQEDTRISKLAEKRRKEGLYKT
jgi:predicted metal-binding protein